MPILEDDDMPDRAAYWAATGLDAAGQPVFAAPVEIWVNLRLRATQGIGPDGSTLTLDATASTPCRLTRDGLLWVAPDWTTDAIQQWYTTGSAGQQDELLRVATTGRTLDARNTETRHTAGLQWFRDGR